MQQILFCLKITINSVDAYTHCQYTSSGTHIINKSIIKFHFMNIRVAKMHHGQTIRLLTKIMKNIIIEYKNIERVLTEMSIKN